MTEKEYEEFIEEFSDALKNDAENAQILIRKGLEAAEEGRWPRASFAFSVALAIINDISHEVKSQAMRAISTEVLDFDEFEIDDEPGGAGHYL